MQQLAKFLKATGRRLRILANVICHLISAIRIFCPFSDGPFFGEYNHKPVLQEKLDQPFKR
ncbi:hypothetical protein [Rhizobium sp. G21]|uniref:hypothetical protein n=1 Tax=Rhizobium sp. G21 TaxID=2758439 RepID=UPI001603CB90|nr:hypothetical protein [Rhizobium sp. G21]MBB1251613.1 hypothetical protein [Rhizobium sp. G21]